MQNRLAVTVANSGDMVVMDHVLGMQVDYMVERFDGGGAIEVFEKAIDMSSWNTGGCYYGPYNRIKQLQSELDIINQFKLRTDKKIKIVDKFVSRRIGQLCNYIVGCHDPYLIKSAGTEGFMSYGEVFDIFLDRMGKYFATVEKNKYYFFTGRLQDIVANELLLMELAENITNEIQKRDVVVWDRGEKSHKLTGLLELMDINVRGLITNNTATECGIEVIGLNQLRLTDIVLIPDEYCCEIAGALEHKNIDNYYFMDQMGKYLTVVYCSRHMEDDSVKPFLNYY